VSPSEASRHLSTCLYVALPLFAPAYTYQELTASPHSHSGRPCRFVSHFVTSSAYPGHQGEASPQTSHLYLLHLEFVSFILPASALTSSFFSSRDDHRVPRARSVYHHPRWHPRHHLRTRRRLHVPHSSQLTRRSHRFDQTVLRRFTRCRSRRRWPTLVIMEISHTNTTPRHCVHHRPIDYRFSVQGRRRFRGQGRRGQHDDDG
jgi:hypothetical protein